jgi:hypothetical protein
VKEQSDDALLPDVRVTLAGLQDAATYDTDATFPDE